MAQFIFKLDGLLRQRKREEQECQRLMAVHAATVNALQDSLRQINAEIVSGTEHVRTHLMGKLDMSFLAAHRRFVASMQRRGMEMVQKLAQAQQQMEAARLKLAEAAKKRKAIEKLREKKQERWRFEQDRKEAALADEIGSQIGYRNAMEDAAKTLPDFADNTA